MLDFPAPVLFGYSRETVITEKLQVLVQLCESAVQTGEQNAGKESRFHTRKVPRRPAAVKRN